MLGFSDRVDLQRVTQMLGFSDRTILPFCLLHDWLIYNEL